MLGLATCHNLPAWEVDDQPLFDALSARGVPYERPVWSDPDVDWSKYRAVLIRTTWDYQERQPEFVAWLRAVSEVTELINPSGVVEWNTHKTYLRDLQRAGAEITPTLWLDRGQSIDLAAALRERGWDRGFIKPMVGATARETLRFANDAVGLREANAHLDRLLPNEGLMLQPYLASVETEGEYSCIYFGGAPSHGVQKIPVAGDYRVQDDFGATDRPHTFSLADLQTIETVKASLNRVLQEQFPGDRVAYARMDFLRSPESTLWLNELELVEPSLFLRHAPEAGERLAEVLMTRLA
jgi:hypothetical protein